MKVFFVGTLVAVWLAFLSGLCMSPKPTLNDEVFQRKAEMLNVVVKVQTTKGSGSGTVIHSGDDGVYILTNHHVMPDADVSDKSLNVLSWIYTDATGPAMPLSQEVEMVADDEADDLTLLRVSDPEWRSHYVAAAMAAKDVPQATEQVYVVGSGLGERVYATEGMVSLVNDHNRYTHTDLMMVSAPAIMGNSGGAAFVKRNGHYWLAGVPELIAGSANSPIPHMAYAIPMKTVRKFLIESGNGTLLDRGR